MKLIVRRRQCMQTEVTRQGQTGRTGCRNRNPVIRTTQPGSILHDLAALARKEEEEEGRGEEEEEEEKEEEEEGRGGGGDGGEGEGEAAGGGGEEGSGYTGKPTADLRAESVRNFNGDSHFSQDILSS